MMYDRLRHYYAYAAADKNLPLNRRLQLAFPGEDPLILDKTRLTEEETSLLHTLFSAEEFDPALDSEHERLLYNWLIEDKKMNTAELERIISLPVRLIHVYLQEETNEKEELTEALKGLFPVSHTCLWQSRNEALLIQQIDSDFDEDLSAESIVDTLTSDFYINVTFYTGSPVTNLTELKERFKWEHHLFKRVKSDFPKKTHFREQELLIYYLLHNVPDSSIEQMAMMLNPVLEDATLVDSVKIYLECNMNTTLAAKKLYMHRNTMQYRVDKFIEKTSVDIKQFPNAVAVYMILSAIESR